MPAAMAIEDLLAREADLDGAPRDHRQLRDDDFMRERIALSSEAAAVGDGDDADIFLRQPHSFGQRLVQIVHVLRARPKREFAVMTALGHAGVLLQRQMGTALIKGDVFPDEVGLGKAGFHVAEFIDLSPMDIAEIPVVMDARLAACRAHPGSK